MKTPRARCGLVLASMLPVLVVLAGCNSLSETVETLSPIAQTSIAMISDSEDRQKAAAGWGVIMAWVDEVDTAEEIALGQSLAVRTIESFGPPYPDRELNRYVNKVGRLVALQSERPSLPYHFVVVQNETPNALSLPGGYVFISTGLLKHLKSESELACILGHEIAHIARKHGLQMASLNRKVSSALDFGQTLTKQDVSDYRRFVDLFYEILTRRGYDRPFETEADLVGTRYAYRAGYNPEGLLPFLEASSRSRTPMAFEVFETHPDPRQRIRDIQGLLGTLGDYSDMPELSDRYRREVLTRLRQVTTLSPLALKYRYEFRTRASTRSEYSAQR